MRLGAAGPRRVDVLAKGLVAAGARADVAARRRALLVARLVAAQGEEVEPARLGRIQHRDRLARAAVPQARAAAVAVDLALAAAAVLRLVVRERLRAQRQARSMGIA